MTSTPQLPGLVTFADGLPGFEKTRHFVLIVSPTLEPFTLVQGLGDGAPSFLTIDPARVDARYQGTLDESDRVRLGAGPSDPLIWLALIAVKEDGGVVNLRAPIVINPATMKGLQVVSAESPYRLDHPLAAA